jgi:photosystem II stability/assembly factor-like uncharacterized protein
MFKVIPPQKIIFLDTSSILRSTTTELIINSKLIKLQIKKVISIILYLLIISDFIVPQTWEFIGGPDGGNVECLAVDSSGNIYTGLRLGGVYTSTNNGNNWIEKNDLIGNITIYKIEVSNNNKVYIGTSGYGLFVTSDLGSHWDRIDSLNAEFIFDIAITAKGNLFVTSYEGLFLSTDEGTSWNLSNNSLTGCVDVSESEYIVANSQDSIYISTDNGSTWENITNNLPQGTIYDVIFGNLNEYIYVNVFTAGIYRSTDMGNTWTSLNNGLNFPVINCLYSSNDGNLFAGTYNNLYLSTDFGEFWFSIKTSGLTYSWIQSVLTNSSGDIFAGTLGGGIYFSSITGNSWEVRSQGLNRAVIRKLLVEDELMFCAAYGSGIFRSSNNGANWEKVNGSISSLNINTLFRHIDGSLFTGTSGGTYRSTDNGETWVFSTSVSANTFASNTLGYIFAGQQGNGLYRSTDLGISWENINNGISYLSIQQLEVSKINDVYACYPDSLLYKSTDNGNSWSLSNTGLQGNLRSMAIDSLDNFYISSNTGFFRSTNDGNSWAQISELNNFREITIAQELGIYGVKSDGVYFSDDNGSKWNLISGQTENIISNSIGIKSNKFIYLGTEGSGLYKFDLLLSTERTIAVGVNNFEIFQNFPNPFNPTTTLKYQIPEISFVTLKIYDVLGNEIATLVNEEKPAGSYEVEFSVGRDSSPDIASGIYFYRIQAVPSGRQAGNFIETKKMILLK